MAQKVFVLDTDFLISCLVTELPNSPGCLAIVQAIIDSGARVIVPDACLDEAANHAGLAHRSVNFFGPRIFGLTRAQALEQIQNAFAAGWFFRNLVEQVEFPEYIQNYYEASAPLDYITRVVESTLPEGVEIGDLVTLLGVSPDKGIEDRLSQELLSIIQKSRKSQYRTPEQTTSLAQTDARIYAAALAYESRTGTGRRGTALGGSCYLITSSLRFIRAVEHVLKHNDEISARPHSIAALFRLVGKTGISAKNFVALFDNPLLQHAVACCREDVNALLEAGLSTRGKTLPRLIWDLDTGLHQKIAEVYAREGEAEKTLGDREELEMDRSYIKLFRDARQRGYSSLPAVRSLAEEITALQEERSDLRKQLDELIGRQEQMETSIGVFGRRKQRYLRRIGRGEGR